MGSKAFRRELLRRLAHGLGLSALMIPPLFAACGGTTVVDGDDGSADASSGDAGSATNSASAGPSTGSGACSGPKTPDTRSRCLGQPEPPCPTDIDGGTKLLTQALEFECCDVDNSNCEVLQQVVCGPYATDVGECCWDYLADDQPCAVPGRPFATCRGAITAGVKNDHRWLDPLEDAPALELDATRGEVWLREALAEHASVASFARFALELMRVGAPLDLVEEAHEAARDEVHHAEMAFAIASAYAGEQMGPERFPIATVRLRGDLTALAVATVHEGCVNETLSTINAAERASIEDDPAALSTLRQIVDDETRHAELAWRFIAWAIARGDEDTRDAITDAFDDAIEAAGDARGIDDVIRPCAEALLIEVRRPKRPSQLP